MLPLNFKQKFLQLFQRAHNFPPLRWMSDLCGSWSVTIRAVFKLCIAICNNLSKISLLPNNIVFLEKKKIKECQSYSIIISVKSRFCTISLPPFLFTKAFPMDFHATTTRKNKTNYQTEKKKIELKASSSNNNNDPNQSSRSDNRQGNLGR